jgi:glycosyltransferase involved in cell wall biosynthesis
MCEISLVVCTRNRLGKLRQCLDALSRISFRQPWQLIVVDNGSTDGTADHLPIAVAAVQAANIKILAEPRRGVARARNVGWRAAAAEIIAFIDDDCYATPSFLDDVLTAFSPDVAAIGGRVLLHDPADLPMTIQESTERHVFEPSSFLRTGLIHGANSSFRRSALEAIGGFDERLGPGSWVASAEDVDALASVIWSGMRVAYDPRPTIYHAHGRRTASDLAALYRHYDSGRGAYYVRNLLRQTSRRTYFQAWASDIRSDARKCLAGLVEGKFTTMRRSRHELLGALRFLASGRRAPGG